MLIGIDGTVAVTPPLSGVGYHIIRLLEALDASAPPEMHFRVFFAATSAEDRSRARLQLPGSSRIRPVAVPFLRTTSGILHDVYWRALLPAAIRLGRCHLFHGPAHVLPRVTRVPTIVTIHDLAFFDLDLYEPSVTTALRKAVRDSMQRATAIIALSEHTKADVHRVTARSKDVHVVYGAGNYPDEQTRTRGESDAPVLVSLGIHVRYVLYVGDFNRRKNLPYLVESFARLKKHPRFSDVQLVLVGKSDGARSELQVSAHTAGLEPGDVVFPGRVADEVLPVLYRNASAFALCSLVEGFTLVTLEAMSYGVPVVATNASSIAEGTGAAAELVPLNAPDVVARALAVAIAPGPRREEMIRGGFERVREFTWRRTADRTIALYEAVLSG